MPQPLAVELFAGAGGLSLGFEQAGFRIALAVESDAKTCETYRYNHPSVDFIEEDVGKLDPRGDPACRVSASETEESNCGSLAGRLVRDFSESNRRTRTLDNPRNHYYLEFFHFVDAMRPRWFVLENVAGLRTLAEGLLLQNIVDRGRSAGYAVDVHELDATEFGVPQVRRQTDFRGGLSIWGASAAPL